MTSFRNNFSALLKLTIPLALTGLVQSSAFFFETLFLAHLNKEILAAGALVSWFLAIFISVFFGALSSINILVAHRYGAKDYHDISFIMRDGLLLAALFSILICILCWNMAPVFLFFGQSEQVVVYAQAYLHSLVWGIIPTFIAMAILELILGLGHARIVMFNSFLTVTLTIFFSYVLIFGKLGFPGLGIAGAGYGMAISNIIAFIVLTIYVISRQEYRKYLNVIFAFKKPVFLWELLHIGLPIGLMWCVEVGFFFVLALIMGTFSTQMLAANQIAMQYLGFLMSIIFSIAQAVTVRMGHLIGAKDYVLAEQAGYMGTAISGTFMFLIALIFWFFPAFLISLDFNVHEAQNLELVRFTEQLIMISPLFQILEAIRISLFGALRALKDTRFTLLTSIISFWGISLPVGYFLATRLNLNGAGLWWGMVVGAAVSVLILIYRFKLKIHAHS